MSELAKIQQFGLIISRDQHHEYRLQAELNARPLEVPGVTKILRAYLRFANCPHDVMAAALLRGTAVHKAIELDCRSVLDHDTLDEIVSPYFKQWRRFLGDSGFKPLLSEFFVGSTRYGYAGELDLAGRLPATAPDWIDLIDVKTGTSVPVTVGLQTAGYAAALCETMTAADPAAAMIKVRRHCLHLTKTNYRLLALNSANDWPVFQSALNLWRWTNEHCKW